MRPIDTGWMHIRAQMTFNRRLGLFSIQMTPLASFDPQQPFLPPSYQCVTHHHSPTHLNDSRSPKYQKVSQMAINSHLTQLMSFQPNPPHIDFLPPSYQCLTHHRSPTHHNNCTSPSDARPTHIRAHFHICWLSFHPNNITDDE